MTPARRAVVEALVAGPAHPTAEQLLAAVRTAHPDVAESTVYRTLDALQEAGLVDHVHLGHGPATFHLAGHGHHHLVCDACGRVVEVDPEVFAGLARELADRHGFELQLGHFALPGRCRTCRTDRERSA